MTRRPPAVGSTNHASLPPIVTLRSPNSGNGGRRPGLHAERSTRSVPRISTGSPAAPRRRRDRRHVRRAPRHDVERDARRRLAADAHDDVAVDRARRHDDGQRALVHREDRGAHGAERDVERLRRGAGGRCPRSGPATRRSRSSAPARGPAGPAARRRSTSKGVARDAFHRDAHRARDGVGRHDHGAGRPEPQGRDRGRALETTPRRGRAASPSRSPRITASSPGATVDGTIEVTIGVAVESPRRRSGR